MSGYATRDLQQAIKEALTNDANLMSIVKGVYDHVEQDSKFPYITIGEGTAVDWDSTTFNGMEMTRTIHTWSRNYGRAETLDIHKEIYRILHKKNITINNQELVNLRFEFEETFLDPDGLTYHGVLRIRAVTRES